MALIHRSAKANDVRAPEVPPGEVVIVGRYSDKKPKVALVNPSDLAMLEDAHSILQAAGQLAGEPIDDLTRKTRVLEDRPDVRSIEDAAAITALLNL